MAFQQILVEKTDRIARVTMNRPRYRNAQSRVMREEMDAAFTDAARDPDVRVIVLAGAGDHFCGGHDLGTPEERADREHRPRPTDLPGDQQTSWDLCVENSLRWRALPKPTIAQVQGYCIFGGWIFASAMDLIVASEDAMFLPGFVQYFSVPWDLTPRKAKEILFQSRFLTAAEAQDLGFVNMVVPSERLEAETMALAGRIAETDPFLARMAKQAINQAQDAMGFSASVEAAHATHMLVHRSGALISHEDAAAGKKRLAPVEQAFRNLER